MPDDPHPPTEPTPLPTGRCRVCGGRATGASELCEGCRGIGEYAAPAGPDAEPFVVHDRLCLACGYSLEGIRSDRECPECGLPVARSLRGKLLRYSSPLYTRQLHLGMLLAEIGTCSLIPVFGINAGLLFGASSIGLSERDATMVGSFCAFGASVVSMIGWWMCSQPDPALSVEDTSKGARKLLRFVLGVEALAGVATFLIPLVLPASVSAGDIAESITGASMLVWLVRFVVSLIYLRALALRIPDGVLRRNAGRFLWLGPLVSVVVCGLGYLVAYAMYVGILDRAREQLRTARRQSETELARV